MWELHIYRVHGGEEGDLITGCLSSVLDLIRGELTKDGDEVIVFTVAKFDKKLSQKVVDRATQ